MGSLYVFCVFLIAVVTTVHCYEEKEENAVDSFDIDQPMHFWNWKQIYDYWKNKGGFVCPAIYGRYAHPKECSLYYECRFSVPHLMQCNRGKLYDEKKEQCRDKRRVKCNKSGRDDDESKESEEEDDKNRVFECPYIWGTFAHPIDCSKYFVCVYNVPTLFQCYGTDLYDERNRRCKDKRRVKCGDRLDRDQMRTSKKPTTVHPTTPMEDKTPGEVTTTVVPLTTEEANKFACPFPYGRYPDPRDCSQFYACHFAIPTLHKCPPSTLYDERREECLEDKKVKCGDRPGGVGGDDEEEKEKEEKEQFRCPYIWGTFPHPDDCSKYIICVYNVPTVFNCRKNELFEAYYRRCFPADQVTCDYRINPDDLTPPPRRTTPLTTTTTTPTTIPTTTTTTPTTTPTTPTTTPITTTTTPIPTTTPTTTTPIPTTTPTTTTPMPTTTPTTTTPIPTTTPTTTAPIPTTTPVITTTLITKPPTTTKKPKPNTPPPTDCDEDDIDCIVDETGDVKRWFDCPERYGHFPHGSSYQLFIHCDNWVPFIKRCADETAFSPKYLVCMWIGKPIPKVTKKY